ncbi:MAG: ATP-binding cassette domain-containing protein, partial [Eggerthella lenta]
MDEANRKNPLETDGRNPLPEHLAARERALYEAAAELERLTDQLFGAEGAGRDCAIASEDPIDGLAPDVVPHEALSHKDAQVHHHHTHAPVSRHEHGHHLLQVEDLSVGFRMYDEDAPFFRAKQREVEVIHSLSISVHAGEIVAVVGASGSGKTLLADAVLGLFEPNATVRGRVWFDGAQQDAASLSALRGHGISLVPQSVNNLDPLMKVGRQVEGFAHAHESRAERRRRRAQLFERYGLPEDTAGKYPHELSGGMARRVLLCCALMDDPRVIVADEPTPGLDLDLAVRALDDFRAFADAGGGVMLITHDIELALRVADRVAVFRDGTVVEETAVANFASPDLLQH